MSAEFYTRVPQELDFDQDLVRLAKPPFFILGCVRSGTTIMRDLLKEHPLLECPEETHFYRWGDPHASPRFRKGYQTQLFKTHRKLDGVNDFQFQLLIDVSRDRRELLSAYGNTYLEGLGKSNQRDQIRLFDKTPQNVYGILLIAADFPDARFVHIHRHPLNVVASLMEGKVMAKHSVVAGVNYWLDSVKILSQFKKLYPAQVLELRYEDVMAQPDERMGELVAFVGEDPSLLPRLKGRTHREKNKYQKVLDRKCIDYVLSECEPYLSQYGYSEEPTG